MILNYTNKVVRFYLKKEAFCKQLMHLQQKVTPLGDKDYHEVFFYDLFIFF